MLDYCISGSYDILNDLVIAIIVSCPHYILLLSTEICLAHLRKTCHQTHLSTSNIHHSLAYLKDFHLLQHMGQTSSILHALSLDEHMQQLFAVAAYTNISMRLSYWLYLHLNENNAGHFVLGVPTLHKALLASSSPDLSGNEIVLNKPDAGSPIIGEMTWTTIYYVSYILLNTHNLLYKMVGAMGFEPMFDVIATTS